jgi:hypothetical protein
MATVRMACCVLLRSLSDVFPSAVPPDCLLAGTARDNHLGNVAMPANPYGGSPNSLQADQFQPETQHYLWTIPQELANQRCVVCRGCAARCHSLG